MQKRDFSSDSRFHNFGFVFREPSTQFRVNHRKVISTHKSPNVNSGRCVSGSNVNKPDLTVEDLITVLSETRNTQGMFNAIGEYCIENDYPVRFFRLMEAAKLLFGRNYMTKKTFLILDFTSRKWSEFEDSSWKNIREIAYERLTSKDKNGLYLTNLSE